MLFNYSLHKFYALLLNIDEYRQILRHIPERTINIFLEANEMRKKKNKGRKENENVCQQILFYYEDFSSTYKKK